MADRAVGAFPAAVAKAAKDAIAAQVVSFFNTRSRGARRRSRGTPAQQAAERWFSEDAVTRRVHGDVTSMMVGGISGLLLQMLHPAVLAGVWDHSNFRADMHGRLRRTARFIAVTTYGSRADAEAAIARVRGIHHHVRGVLPNGVPYAASDPSLLAWVHVAETTSFLRGWVRYGESSMSEADQDRYFAEMATIADALGANPVPRSKSEARSLIAAMRPQLVCDARTREVAQLVLTQPAPNWVAWPVQTLGMQAAVDLLPPWARRMHGLQTSPLRIPVVRTGTLGVARVVRWALD
ncbi:MAG: DUF2236 domain-containing protein [Acetobacteraceae bacterium]|nr:DUF2236 domain-containing protein [Acetobacteraceae bacterium]